MESPLRIQLIDAWLAVKHAILSGYMGIHALDEEQRAGLILFVHGDEALAVFDGMRLRTKRALHRRWPRLRALLVSAVSEERNPMLDPQKGDVAVRKRGKVPVVVDKVTRHLSSDDIAYLYVTWTTPGGRERRAEIIAMQWHTEYRDHARGDADE